MQSSTGEVLITAGGYVESKQDLERLVEPGLAKVQLRALLTWPKLQRARSATASPHSNVVLRLVLSQLSPLVSLVLS